MEISKHEKSATRKNCNMKRIQDAESATEKAYSMEKVQHEKGQYVKSE